VRERKADRQADPHDQQAARDDHDAQRSGAGAERKPNSELAPAADDCGGHRAGEADDEQDQRNDREK
jgi:hypothetical protein